MTDKWTEENVRDKLWEDLHKKGKVFEFMDKETMKLEYFQNNGGCNFVFLLTDKYKTTVIKWTSPFVRTFSSMLLSQSRGNFEREYLLFANQMWPGSGPDVLFYDKEHFYFCMTYLDGYSNIKEKLIKGDKNEHFAKLVGTYLAQKAWDTSIYKLSKEQFQESIMEKFDANGNAGGIVDYQNFLCLGALDPKKYPEMIQPILTSMQKDEKIKAFLNDLATTMKVKENLTHGDFHTGGVLIKDDQFAVLDCEAGRVGPIAYDVGIFIGNMLVAYCFQPWFQGDRAEFAKWILEQVVVLYKTFESKWLELSGKKSTFLKETIGYTGIIVLRSRIDPWTWPEYGYIKAEERDLAALYSLKLAELMLTQDFASIEDLCAAIEKVPYK